MICFPLLLGTWWRIMELKWQQGRFRQDIRKNHDRLSNFYFRTCFFFPFVCLGDAPGLSLDEFTVLGVFHSCDTVTVSEVLLSGSICLNSAWFLPWLLGHHIFGVSTQKTLGAESKMFSGSRVNRTEGIFWGQNPKFTTSKCSLSIVFGLTYDFWVLPVA